MNIKPIIEAPKDSSYICVIYTNGEIEIAWKEDRAWHIRSIPGGGVRLGNIAMGYIGWVRFNELFASIKNITQKFTNIKAGDKIRIHNKTENIAWPPGFYECDVIDSDAHSFAIESFGKWWFYRDTGESYTGNAVVVKIL